MILYCLKPLFDHQNQRVTLQDAERQLADMLTSFINDSDLGLSNSDPLAEAKRELRAWIKRGLLIERDGQLQATDALQRSLRFVEGLDKRHSMTSTASRLGVVQREVATLSVRLGTNPQMAAEHLRGQIAELEQQLHDIEQGAFVACSDEEAEESIADLYNLAMSLLADFRRVEDSYRDADRSLRQAMIQQTQHRGVMVDGLLDAHDALLQTPEGQVFSNFHDQLREAVSLASMREHMINVLKHPAATRILSREQQAELRLLKMLLTREAQQVVRARARGEQDVKNFIQTGLATEHHRVGHLLTQLLEQALHLDWSRQSLRRSSAPLPQMGVTMASVPLVERLRFKEVPTDDKPSLDLHATHLSLAEVGDAFWEAFNTLDRQALWQATHSLLAIHDAPLRIATLAELLLGAQKCGSDEAPIDSPEKNDVNTNFREHDLEVITLWLGMAAADDDTKTTLQSLFCPHDNTDAVDVARADGGHTRFFIPRLTLSMAQCEAMQWKV